MRRVARRTGETATLLEEAVNEEVARGLETGRARVGMVETKAIVLRVDVEGVDVR